jgi:hypothetical protein
MEISEAMDIRTRQGLLNALAGKVGKRMDSLLVPLELLCCVSRTEFSDKKAYLRWQKRQLNMLAEGLINNPVVGFGESGRKATDLKSLLLRIEESESLPSSAGEVQRAECLKSLREVAISLAERPARGDLTGEVCHWADGYHLNVRLYEKLLLCVFDILNDGKLTEVCEFCQNFIEYIFQKQYSWSFKNHIDLKGFCSFYQLTLFELLRFLCFVFPSYYNSHIHYQKEILDKLPYSLLFLLL